MTPATDFKNGDPVQLNSGGPTMTVEKVEGDAVTCIWFRVPHEEPASKVFTAAMLKKAAHTAP